VNLATRYHQVVIEYLATYACRSTSDNLVKKEDRQWVFSDIFLPDHKQQFSDKLSKIASD
jgi:hypothetical protein